MTTLGTKIFLFIFIAYGGEQYAMDVGQFDDEIACRITMEEVFDDLQADGFRADQMTAVCQPSGLPVVVAHN